MSKKRWISKVLLTTSLLSVSSFAFLNGNIKNESSISKISSTANTAYSSSVNETNIDVSSLSFVGDTYNDSTSTPYGYIKVDQSTKKIHMISFFGNIAWSYNPATSPFLKRIGSSVTVSSIHVKYNKEIDTIIVYGIASTRNFIFQLKAENGSEYYVNSSSPNVVGSSLIEGLDTGILTDDINQISYVGNNNFIFLPKNFGANKMLNTYNVNLTSYISSPLNINLTSTTDGSATYTTNNIINVTKINNQYGIFFSAIKTGTNNKKEIGVLGVLLDSSLKYVSNNFISFKDVGSNSTTNNNDIFNKTNFNFVVPSSAGATNKILFVLQDLQYKDSYTSDVVGEFNFSQNKAMTTSSHTIKNSSDAINITNIYEDEYNAGKIYVTGKGTTNGNINKFGIVEYSDADITNFSFINLPETTTTTNSKIAFNFRKVTDKSITSYSGPTNAVYSIIEMDNSFNVTNRKVGSMQFNKNTKSISITKTDNFNPTKIGTYTNLVQENPFLLPQDVTVEVLGRYIYLHKPDSTDKLFESKITSNGKFTANNNNGTLRGTVNLTLKKWWTDSETINYPIDINISGLATNSGLKFELVKSKVVDSTKYQQIVNLQETRFPSQITKQEILDSFIVKGSNLNITTDNIQIVNSNQTTRNPESTSNIITVTTDDNIGTLKIDYDLTPITSPSMLNKTGTYTFTNFKQLNTWQKVAVNLSRWESLKKTKMPFQITKKDLVNALELSSSYKTDESYWTWTPSYTLENNKDSYIKQNIDGTLSGTLSYNRQLGGTPDSIGENITKIDFTATGDNANGTGFTTIISRMGNSSNLTMSYNREVANKLASSYSYDQVQENLTKILDESVSFYDNWTTVDSLELSKPTSLSGSELNYEAKFKTRDIRTNFENSNGTKLVLDADWIRMINENSEILKQGSNISFIYNQTVYSWNYDISINSSSFSIQNLSQTSTIPEDELNRYYKQIPSQFAKNFHDSENNTYISFQTKLQLLAPNTTTDTSSINYFIIKDVQLFPNDVDGTIEVQYTVSYPNVGNASSTGKTIYPRIILNGFPTLQGEINAWTYSAIAVGSITILSGGIFGIWVFFNRRKMLNENIKYNKRYSNKNIEIEEKQMHNKPINSTKQKIRNTRHDYILNQTKNRNVDIRIKNYTKMMKEIKKSKKG